MDRTRRRIGIVALVVTVVLFVVELVALSLGRLDIAAVCFVAFMVGWFVVRAWVKRAERRSTDTYRPKDGTA